MTTVLRATLAFAALTSSAWAYRPAPSATPPDPAAFLVTVEEGSPWGEHRLYLRLFPPARGIPHEIPFMAGTMSGQGIAAFEVAPARNAPTLRPAGWAELGKIPTDGEYTLRVSAADAGTRTFKLKLAEGQLELSPLSGSGRLEVAVPRSTRLPKHAFTYRIEQPTGCCHNHAIDRKMWRASVYSEPTVKELTRPERALSDSEFEAWLDDGSPLLHGSDPKVIYRLMTELALESELNLVVRWYGGVTWDLRDFREGLCPEPCWLPNLDYTIPVHLR